MSDWINKKKKTILLMEPVIQNVKYLNQFYDRKLLKIIF